MQQTDPALIALAEQLKTPLVQIMHLSEQGLDESKHISLLSQQALRSIDALVLARQSEVLPLEPVSMGAVFYDVAHVLTPLAHSRNIELVVDHKPRSVPLMAHIKGLQGFLELAGDAMMHIITLQVEPQKARQIVLGGYRNGRNYTVGVFGTGKMLSQASIQTARNLRGRAAQVSPSVGSAAGGSLVAADLLAAQLQSTLRVYQHKSLRGLGIQLPISKQLTLLS